MHKLEAGSDPVTKRSSDRIPITVPRKFEKFFGIVSRLLGLGLTSYTEKFETNLPPQFTFEPVIRIPYVHPVFVGQHPADRY